MIRKPSDTQALGLDLDLNELKTAHLEMSRGQVKVKRLEAYSINVKGLFASEKEAKVCHEQVARYLTVGGLDGADTLIRRLKIKLLKKKDVESAFPFEAETQLPYPSEEAILDKIYLETEEDSTYLTLLSAKKEAIKNLIDRFHTLEIEPEVLTSTPHALAAFEGKFCEKKEDVLVLFLGETYSMIALVREGKLLTSHSIQTGLDKLKKAYVEDQTREPEILEEEFSQLDFSGEQIALAPALKESFQKYVMDIKWMVLSELKNTKNNLPILYVGEGACLKGIESALFGDLPLEKLEIKIFEGSELNLNLLKKFAIAIGFALTALPQYPDPINFRQGDFEYPHPWKRFKGAIGLFIGSSLLLALMIFLFGEAYLGYKEDGYRQNFAELLAENGKSYSDFEKQFESKGKKGEVSEIIPLKDLTIQEIEARVQTLKKDFQAVPDLYPLAPNVPLVSDTLAWLSSIPEMKSADGAIQIDSFYYTMVKRPDMTKKGEKYQVRVDLELNSPTPKMARELHNALIQPNDFIDPKEEVKWSHAKGKYRTSFYLKDKTTYLSGSK